MNFVLERCFEGRMEMGACSPSFFVELESVRRNVAQWTVTVRPESKFS